LEEVPEGSKTENPKESAEKQKSDPKDEDPKVVEMDKTKRIIKEAAMTISECDPFKDAKPLHYALQKEEKEDVDLNNTASVCVLTPVRASKRDKKGLIGVAL
jgi:hypothetical protein